MFFSAAHVVVLRLFELLASSIILSLAATALHTTETVASSDVGVLWLLTICVVIFITINVRFMRNCFYDLSDHRVYYVSNLIAYALFTVICFSVFYLGNNELYTWMFSITKFAKFIIKGLETLGSVIIFHVLGIASVFLAPIGMGWIFHAEEGEEHEEEIDPREFILDAEYKEYEYGEYEYEEEDE